VQNNINDMQLILLYDALHFIINYTCNALHVHWNLSVKKAKISLPPKLRPCNKNCHSYLYIKEATLQKMCCNCVKWNVLWLYFILSHMISYGMWPKWLKRYRITSRCSFQVKIPKVKHDPHIKLQIVKPRQWQAQTQEKHSKWKPTCSYNNVIKMQSVLLLLLIWLVLRGH